MNNENLIEFVEMNGRRVILQKCSKCGKVVRRSFRMKNITCFSCKLKRSREISRKRNEEDKEKRRIKRQERKCILCQKKGISRTYCSDKCRREYNNLSYAEKHNLEKL